MLQMMTDNEQAPEIERLDRHEFNLDTDQRQKLVLEGEEKIKQVCSFRLFCMHLISGFLCHASTGCFFWSKQQVLFVSLGRWADSAICWISLNPVD